MLLYRLILKSRAKAWRKAPHAEVPTICVGNITVGGTGKTPHTEMILDLLQQHFKWGSANLAVLSRGYRRRSWGFQEVKTDSTAAFAGDEPLQIKRKFPAVTVAVDKDRVEGCRKLRSDICPPADLIVLDDAFQYRRLKATYNIILVDYNRPVHKDTLLPWGRLRDLPSRMADADMIIVSKCPQYMEDSERQDWALALGIKDYDSATCRGCSAKGKEQVLLFTSVAYKPMVPVYPDKADSRFTYARRVVLFSGIANDLPLRSYLSDSYKIARHLEFPDHHQYSSKDIKSIVNAMKAFPTACVATTEKDAGRILDCKKIPAELKERLFQVPIEISFLSELEQQVFEASLLGVLKPFAPQ